MKSKKVCIGIPIYKIDPSHNELNALARVVELYGKSYDIYLLGPTGLDTSNYPIKEDKLELVNHHQRYFQSVFSYNLLLMQSGFYKPFLKYQYLLIYQLDAFILSDRLEEVCEWGYDYIGAPWSDNSWMETMNQKLKTSFFTRFFLKVGNGGFSLRNVKKSYRIALFFTPFKLFWKAKWNEDIFWSTICHRFVPGYNVAPKNKALEFSIEESPKESIKSMNEALPFGCHAWEKNEPLFWKKHFQKLGYEMDYENSAS